MNDIEKAALQSAMTKAAELANATSESFVLAVTAAYMAGMEAGKLAAQGAA